MSQSLKQELVWRVKGSETCMEQKSRGVGDEFRGLVMRQLCRALGTMNNDFSKCLLKLYYLGNLSSYVLAFTPKVSSSIP